MELLWRSLFFWNKMIMWWGPGVHLHIAGSVADPKLINEELYEKIEKEKDAFYYGSISPDITLGKKYIKEAEKHSHMWDTGFNVVRKARNDREFVLGLGYLTHLAADVVAHNFFLPKQLLAGYGFRSFSHTMWEIKIDMSLYKETNSIIKNIVNGNFENEDSYLREIVSDSLIPFGVNRKIFDYSLKSIKNRYFYSLSNLIMRHEEWHTENKEFLKEYHEVSLKLAIDIVNKLEESKVIKYDPNGYEHLESISELRKEYKAMGIDNFEKNLYNIPKEIL